MATPIQIFAGTEEGRMRRKRRIGEGVCYIPQKSFISLKEKLYADNHNESGGAVFGNFEQLRLQFIFFIRFQSLPGQALAYKLLA